MCCWEKGLGRRRYFLPNPGSEARARGDKVGLCFSAGRPRPPLALGFREPMTRKSCEFKGNERGEMVARAARGIDVVLRAGFAFCSRYTRYRGEQVLLKENERSGAERDAQKARKTHVDAGREVGVIAFQSDAAGRSVMLLIQSNSFQLRRVPEHRNLML